MTKIGVIIPCYRVKKQIVRVVENTLPYCDIIYIVDDKCPEQTGSYAKRHFSHLPVRVLFHEANAGVGGAALTGFHAALQDGCDILVKVDGDGQMPSDQIPALVKPIVAGFADYVKGNRFFFLSNAAAMPRVRRLGNLALSFLSKASSGYWDIMDPTNGFLAIEARVCKLLPHDRIAKRFFFESDLLFHLGLLRARVVDFPMHAIYGDEKSNLKISRNICSFLARHLCNAYRRIFYRYFIRDFSLASIELVAGVALFMFGFIFGSITWVGGVANNVSAETGTIMLSVVPLLMGFQLLLAFVNYDICSVPREPLHQFLRGLDQESDRILPEKDKALAHRSGIGAHEIIAPIAVIRIPD